MKIRTAFVLFAVVLLPIPIFACGQMSGGGTTMTNNSGSGRRQMSPGRNQWTKKRIKHLRREMDDYNKANTVAREMDRASGAVNNDAGRFFFPSGMSARAQRQHMINRYEFLALKAERGKASADDKAEMRALQHALLGR